MWARLWGGGGTAEPLPCTIEEPLQEREVGGGKSCRVCACLARRETNLETKHRAQVESATTPEAGRAYRGEADEWKSEASSGNSSICMMDGNPGNPVP